MRQDEVKEVIIHGGEWTARDIAERIVEDGATKSDIVHVHRCLRAFHRYGLVEICEVRVCPQYETMLWRWVG